jgi:3-hydroxybutyrate dehydrogenase
MVDQAVAEFGGVEILVNNAGLQHVSPIEEFPLERWNRLLAVMLTGPFLCTKATLPWMRRAGWGRVINVASIHGKYASPYKAAYIAAKHGLIGLTRSTAIETAEAGITANAICPGFVDTPLVRGQIPDLMRNLGVETPEEALEIAIYSKTPQRRFLDSAEVGGLAAYLASDAARGITGQAINLDGGMVMH